MKHCFCIYLFPKEYEKLWEAVTGGRGTGRGKRKSVVKGVDPKLLKYGKQIFLLAIGTVHVYCRAVIKRRGPGISPGY